MSFDWNSLQELLVSYFKSQGVRGRKISITPNGKLSFSVKLEPTKRTTTVEAPILDSDWDTILRLPFTKDDLEFFKFLKARYNPLLSESDFPRPKKGIYGNLHQFATRVNKIFREKRMKYRFTQRRRTDYRYKIFIKKTV